VGKVMKMASIENIFPENRYFQLRLVLVQDNLSDSVLNI
jgi:uncharacterized protein YpbB